MVKSVLGDETQFKSTEDRLFNSNLPSEIGLVIGKLNSSLDRAFIFDLIPTPPNDNSQPASSLSSIKPDKKKKLSKAAAKSQTDSPSSPSLLLDTDWIAEHARQVSQMLLGGINVIGIYIWSPDSSLSSSSATLLQVIKGVASATPPPEHILVHFSYSPRKLSIRNCSIGSSSFRVCDFKLGRVLGSLRSFKCLYNFEMKLPVLKEGTFRELIRDGILRNAKELRDAKAIIDGNLVVDDQLPVSDDSHIVELLLPVVKDFFGQVKEEIVGIVVFSGFVCSVAYLSPKESIQQAISDIKEDIIMSLQSRLNIICDEGDEGLKSMGDGEEGESVEVSKERSMIQLELRLLKKPTSILFPRRVLVPWKGDVFICDYLQQSETFEVVKDHCKELMCMEAPGDSSLILEPEKEAISLTVKSFWDVVVPGSSAYGSDSNSMVNKEKDSTQKEGSKASVKLANFNTVTAIAILLLAIVIGFLFYHS